LITLVKMKLPEQFLKSIAGAKGFEKEAFEKVHASEERITSIRLNPFKKVEQDLLLGKKVLWCDNGFYLDERPSFTFDPLFHAGCYYVQEAGSMFLQYALKSSVDLKNDITVLDLCAAPGGKSTLINDNINENSILISNEVIKTRADILTHNLTKWGTCNTAVTNCDPAVFGKMPEIFDVIVTDVPCSGSGLFRKQPDAIKEWSLENVDHCSVRQKRILGDVLNCLKKDGILIYSTCSYSEAENERIVEWLMRDLSMELIPLPVEKDWGIIDTGLGYRFYPNLTKSEGFFCAVLKKTSGEEYHTHRSKKNNLDQPSKAQQSLISGYLKPNDKVIAGFKSEFKLMNKALHEFYNLFGKELYFKKLGTVLGEFKHADFLPDHELANSIYVSDSIPYCDLNKTEAISFLKKENLNLKMQKGICLMTYKKQGLGWAKVLDNRINNYLPKNFRILSNEEF
jgi:16S rRNA C967 or C1407 C5-methylase (RsmB/RsmF family)/NOL1/NOP2/fmu family ribosome biogenesis protein